MKTIKNKIKVVVQWSNGFPTYTQREYLDSIRLLLNEKLSNDELHYIQDKKINLDAWIMEVTKDLTEDLF
jgi:predicted house-cleaning noncanonical NTP pyrophosphatase (MazG superfamily)